MISFEYFRPLQFVSSRSWVGVRSDHTTVFRKNCECMFYHCMLSGFYCALKSSSARKVSQTYGKCSDFYIFNRFLRFFSQSFWAVQGVADIRNTLNEKMALVVAYAMAFVLLCDRDRLREVLTLMKMINFLTFLAV